MDGARQIDQKLINMQSKARPCLAVNGNERERCLNLPTDALAVPDDSTPHSLRSAAHDQNNTPTLRPQVPNWV